MLFLRRSILLLCLGLVMPNIEADTEVLSSRALKCLTDNAYFESRGESEKGQLAVIFTTLNRVKHPNFPKDVCKVVYADSQFSWVRNKNHVIKEPETYEKIKTLAKEVAQGKHKDVTRGALFFHANNIKPKWSKSLDCTARIGGHVFYK